MRFNILIGGEAGQGPNILTHTLGKALIRKGFYVFYYRDYASLIRGGHNFNVLTFSNDPVYSHDSEIDILVALDENTLKLHKNKLKKKSATLDGKGANMFFAGKLFKTLGLEFESLDKELKELKRRYDENIKESKEGYEHADQVFSLDIPNVDEIIEGQDRFFRNGSKAISEGAIKAGLDVYYAYPMTPATGVMGELAEKQIENNHIVIELENELAVANAGVGSAITGAKTMVGTSGGGFDLMGETLSMAGMAGIPLVFYLAQRPGPGTNIATYQSQGDLDMARCSGHGEFCRVVFAPGDIKEAEELTAQAFYFSQRFQVPAIVLSDKHLAESFYTMDWKPKIIASPKLTKLGRFNSYEKDSEGSATEDPEMVKRNVDFRNKKRILVEDAAKSFKGYKTFGNEDSENVIVAWGSTKGAILDVIKTGIDAKFVQILHIEPFPKETIWKQLIGKNIILVENNSTGQLGELIKTKTGFNIPDKNKILKYDGRPFLKDELEKEISRRLR